MWTLIVASVTTHMRAIILLECPFTKPLRICSSRSDKLRRLRSEDVAPELLTVRKGVAARQVDAFVVDGAGVQAPGDELAWSARSAGLLGNQTANVNLSPLIAGNDASAAYHYSMRFRMHARCCAI